MLQRDAAGMMNSSHAVVRRWRQSVACGAL